MSVRGSIKFAVMMCKFQDTASVEPFQAGYLEDLVARRGTGGANDYWRDASLGNVNLDGSRVFDWRVMQQTREDFLATHSDRWDKIQAAVDLFPEIPEEEYPFVIAVYNVPVEDAGKSYRGVLMPPANANVTWLAHETGHIMGLKHSFDPSKRKLHTWSQPGEYYDRYDIMSADNVFRRPDEHFRWAGPLLNTANLDRMDWLPAGRVWFAPPASHSYIEEFDLVSLSCPEIPGFLSAQIDNLYLEFRTQDRWDTAIPGDAVLIHQMIGANSLILASQRPVVELDGPSPLTNSAGNRWVYSWTAGQTYSPQEELEFGIHGGTRIMVESIDSSTKKAHIRVHHRAVQPYVAGPGQIFGGVAAGGDGWIITPDGRRVPVPPYSPLVNVIRQMAIIAEAEQTLTPEASQAVTREVLENVVRSLQYILQRMP